MAAQRIRAAAMRRPDGVNDSGFRPELTGCGCNLRTYESTHVECKLQDCECFYAVLCALLSMDVDGCR